MNKNGLKRFFHRVICLALSYILFATTICVQKGCNFVVNISISNPFHIHTTSPDLSINISYAVIILLCRMVKYYIISEHLLFIKA